MDSEMEPFLLQCASLAPFEVLATFEVLAAFENDSEN